jgi:hypothetical protein
MLVRAFVALFALAALALPGVVGAPAAFAACPVNQPCDPAPGPHPTPTPKPTYEVNVSVFQVLDLQDGPDLDGGFDNYDETYIKLNGAKVWGTYSVGLGFHTANLKKQTVTATTVGFYDEDDLSGDDTIGVLTINPPATPTTIGVPVSHTADLYGSGGHYRVKYSQTRIK